MSIKHKPKVIVAGFSAYSRIIDWQRFRDVADEVNAYLLVDMAHVAGLVAAGLYPNPVSIADVTTTTTHKTLRGPRGGLILARENAELTKRFNSLVFPGVQGGPLMHVIAAKAVALLEALALKTPIVISNCSSSLGLVMTSRNDPHELSFFNERLETDCGWIVNRLNESAETIEIWQDCLEKVVLESYPLNNRDSGSLAAVKQFDVIQVREAWKSLLSDIS